MFDFQLRPLKRLFQPATAQPLAYCYYPIGDVHAYPDALRRIFAKIRIHHEANPAIDTRIIQLGDLVNRGPDSRGTLAYAREEEDRCKKEGISLTLLPGNHEIGLVHFLSSVIQPDQDIDHTNRLFLDKGGLNTLASYGVHIKPASPYEYKHVHTIEGCRLRVGPEELQEAQAALREAMPESHQKLLLRILQTAFVETENHFFVHAGINPLRSLAEQYTDTLLGLDQASRDFASYEQPLEKIVVHGHTPTKRAYSNAAQINLDTGIYKWRRISAAAISPLGLQFLTAHSDLPVYDKTHQPQPAGAASPAPA